MHAELVGFSALTLMQSSWIFSPLHMVLQAMTSPTQVDKLGTDWNWDAETVSKSNGFLY
jgi:hypothetical protein